MAEAQGEAQFWSMACICGICFIVWGIFVAYALDETCASFSKIGAHMPWAHLIFKEKASPIYSMHVLNNYLSVCIYACIWQTYALIFLYAISNYCSFSISNFKLLHDPWDCSLLLNCICSFSWSQKRQNAAFLPGMKCDLCVFCFVVKLNKLKSPLPSCITKHKGVLSI